MLGGLYLAACGDDDDDGLTTPSEGGQTPSGSASPELSPTATPHPAEGGILRSTLYGLSSASPPTLYPFEVSSFLTAAASAYHYSRLLRFANRPGLDPLDFVTVEGDIVELPEQPDPQTFVFGLKPEARFHNLPPVNGRACTTADLVEAQAAFLASGSEAAGQWSAVVDGFEATDGQAVTVRLKKPYAPFLTLAASAEHLWIVPREVIEGDQERPIGTGPWVFEEMVPDNRITWTGNPDYFDAGQPYLDGVECSLISDPATIFASLETGQLDESYLDPSLYEQTQAIDGLELLTNRSQTIGGVFFNLDEPPWSDVRVRQAVSLALDRDGMRAALDRAGAGASFTAISHLSEFYLDPETPDFGFNRRWFRHDASAARDLLEAAGASELPDLELIYSPAYGTVFLQLFQIVQEQLRQVGIETTVREVPYPEYRSTQFYGQFTNALAVGPLYTAIDPDILLFTVYHPQSGRHNWGGALDSASAPGGDAELLAMFAASESELVHEARVEKVHEIQRYMAEKMYVVPYYGWGQLIAKQPWVRNFNWKTGVSVGTDVFRTVWLDQS
jgi:ABC-type transport system substrate-binding protein